jgi:WD40 repeat protein
MKERLYAAGVLLGVVAIIGVVAWVFFYGRLDPSPPSLRDNPQPSFPGEILYVNDDSCIIAARASGESYREITCQRDIEGVSWLSDGRILYSTSGPEYRWFVFDPQTGESERVESQLSYWEVFDQQRLESVNGELYVYDNGGDIIISDADGNERTIFEYDGPDGWRVEFRSWSPDGSHLLVYYGKDEELWVIAADGSGAGTLTGDARWANVSWNIEGVGYLPEMRRPIGGLD